MFHRLSRFRIVAVHFCIFADFFLASRWYLHFSTWFIFIISKMGRNAQRKKNSEKKGLNKIIKYSDGVSVTGWDTYKCTWMRPKIPTLFSLSATVNYFRRCYFYLFSSIKFQRRGIKPQQAFRLLSICISNGLISTFAPVFPICCNNCHGDY